MPGRARKSPARKTVPDGRERRHARAKAEIVAAAARAFARHGFHGTSVDDVAREAGMSPSSLYRYFDGKEAVYRALVEEIARVLDAPFTDPLLSSLPFGKRLEWVIRRQLSIVEARREFFITFSADRASMDWELASTEDLTGDAYNRWVEAFTALLEQGVAAGELRSINTSNAAYLLSGALSATVFRWIRGQLPGDLQEYVPVMLEMILQGIGSKKSRSA